MDFLTGILKIEWYTCLSRTWKKGLMHQEYGNIWFFSISFGVLLFISGFILGYKDPVRESRSDLGFKYHLTTFIIVNIIGISWLFAAMGFNANSLMNAAFQCLPWGLGLLIHYYFSSKSIKGIDKKDLFD